jgi:signal transduction histidine kinase
MSRAAAIGLSTSTFALAAAVLALRAAGHARPLAYEDLLFFPEVLAFSAAGALVVSRRPRTPVGWSLMAVGLSWTLVGALDAYVDHVLAVGPHQAHSGMWAAWVVNWVWLLAFVALGYFFLVFPDGRLPGRRWRVAALVGAVGAVLVLAGRAVMPGPLAETPTIINPLGIHGAGGFLAVLEAVGQQMVGVAVIASIVSLFVRFRRADVEPRRQLLWMALAGLVMAAVMSVGNVLQLAGITGIDVGDVYVASFAAIPVAAAIAILRHHLYDIELVVSRTVVYAALAVFIAALYVAVVVGVGVAIGTRGRPNLALSVLVTAIVAVAFQPVRSKVERSASRLVYGRRSSPYEVLSRFSMEMAGAYPSRDLLRHMARVVAEGIGARHVEVWLRHGPRFVEAGAWPHQRSGLEPRPVGDGDFAEPSRSGRTVLVRDRGDVLGALVVRAELLSRAQGRLLSDLAAQAGLVLRSVGLVEDLRASRLRLVTVQDAERRQLQREIHDRVERRLVTVAAALSATHGLADDDGQLLVLSRLCAETAGAASEIRELSRGVYPALLTEQGLIAALMAQTRAMTSLVTLQADGIGRYAVEIEAAVYFCCLEALQNVSKHAYAERTVVRLAEGHGRLQFTVEDDGKGFHSSGIAVGSGLQNIADRVEALGGRVLVSSTPGQGTIVSGWLPGSPLRPDL